jgi:hypothetical protein
VLRLDAGGDQVLCSLAEEELLEEVEWGRDKSQAIQDHGLHRLARANMLLGVSAQQLVYLLDEADLVDDAGHDPQMVDVLNLDLWCNWLVHATENTSTCTLNLRKVGFGLGF